MLWYLILTLVVALPICLYIFLLWYVHNYRLIFGSQMKHYTRSMFELMLIPAFELKHGRSLRPWAIKFIRHYYNVRDIFAI